MTSKRTSLTAVIAAAALAAAITIPSLSGAQSPPRTITLQERVQTAVGDDVAPKSKRGPIMSPRGRVSVGDRLVVRQAAFDASNQRIGTLYTDCAGVGPTKPLFQGAQLLCTVTYKLSDGQIVAAGAAPLSGFEVPIVGGTGAYAGARGTVETAKPAKGYDSADRIIITG